MSRTAAPGALALHSFDFAAMGVRCRIRLHAADAHQAARAIGDAVSDIDRLQKKFSCAIPGNFMHRLNLAAGHGGTMWVDDECRLLLDHADLCHRQSDGLFDISGGWQHVRRVGHEVRFARPGLALDFGGIVRAHAVDRAAAACRRHGLLHGVVELGADIAVIGPTPDGEAWTLPIAHPYRPDTAVASFRLTGGSLATSADAFGRPAQDLASVTVEAEHCLQAGGACTTALLKNTHGVAWLAALGLPHLWVKLDGAIGGMIHSANGRLHPPGILPT